ncbi:MAG TPA: VOC family protein [Anaerolineae bacterium]|nr:VOC family protein [Anaerolineae bacterium]
MTQLSPYLKFDGNCHEAMTFYQKCLGGELSLQAVEETPMAAQMPAEAQKKILHATLTHGGIVLMASDMVGPEGLVHGSTIFLSLDCGSEEEIKTFFSKLSAGGQVTYPLKTEFWGATFGQVIDKYGMTWLLNYTQNPPE